MKHTSRISAQSDSQETVLNALLHQLHTPLMIIGAYSLMLQHRLRHGHDIDTQLRLDHLSALERATHRIEERCCGGTFDVAVARQQAARQCDRERTFPLGSLRALRSIARERDDVASSLAYYRECLALLGEQGDLRTVVDMLEHAAEAAVMWGQPARAARILGAADALSEQSGTRPATTARSSAYRRAREAICAALGEHNALRASSAGRRLPLPLAIAEVLALKPPTDTTPPAPGVPLSRRESEVLHLLADGHSDQEIARRLHLSARTVEVHVRRLRAKLGARSRTGAVSTAIATGLLMPRRASMR